MRYVTCTVGVVLWFTILFSASCAFAERMRIKAIGIPLADHYAGIVAYEKYRGEMQYADYQLEILPDPALVRSYFRSEPDADIAFNVSPMVMEMFARKPNFRWVSLIHRDGNALAVNELINRKVDLPADRALRLPGKKIADAFTALKEETGKPVEVAIPSPLATHAVVLYKYLKDHGKTFGYSMNQNVDVVLVTVKPAKAPVYLKKRAVRSKPAAFEQSLPWAEEVENNGFGFVGWYSKDVMKHEHGHVECIIIAKDEVIKEKREALQEVLRYIRKAGSDIEAARRRGGREMDEIVKMIRKHIPAHTKDAITQSLRIDLNVINYLNLNVDADARASFEEIMDLAFEAGFIKQKINIDKLADESFNSDDF